MAKSPLFTLFQRLMRDALREMHVEGGAARKPLSRRQFLSVSLASVALVPLAAHARIEEPMLGAFNPPLAKKTRIAVVGGGVAGLTAVLKLAEAGHKVDLYEASNRLGGRMWTQYDVGSEGLFCELGGELVDTNHTALRDLCTELDVGLQKLEADDTNATDLYYFAGEWRTPHDLIDTVKQNGAFAPLAKAVAKDAALLTNADGEWTLHARTLDALSLRDYLDNLIPDVEEWVLKLVEVAYVGEYGRELTDQSSLNLVAMLGTDLSQEMALFGESDEAWRIEGGSSHLIEALEERLKGHASIRLSHRLIAMGEEDGELSLTFEQGRQSHNYNYPRVVLALPFTLLREVSGIFDLGLADEQANAIRSLGYGQNAKIMFETATRFWREGGFAAPTNRNFFTDLSMQCLWETSRNQRGKAGILTNFLGGHAGTGLAAERIAESYDELRGLFGVHHDEVKTDALASFFWARHAWTRGSYTCPMPGQYTTLLGACSMPALDGRLFFAGEHTSVESNGYMNGAIESALRVVREVSETLTK